MSENPFDPSRGWTTKYKPGLRAYPELETSLRMQLDRVQPSHDGDFVYKPCELTLSDGTVVDRVYVHDAASYIRAWGIWPEDDESKRSLDLALVIHIRESSTRLPIRFADSLYKAGESGMGGYVFTVQFSGGLRQVYRTGNLVDFIPMPGKKTLNDVIRVYPHEGRGAVNFLGGSGYHWCLFGSGESNAVSWRWQPDAYHAAGADR